MSDKPWLDDMGQYMASMGDDRRDEVWGYVKEALDAAQKLGTAFRDRSLSTEGFQEISRRAITTEAVARAAIYESVRGA